jgi:hypothetical protein
MSLYSLATWRCTYEDPFLVQYEIPVPKDDRTRMYIVFNGISEYLNSRYRTCHEVFISGDGWSSDNDIIAHPAFDIDAELGSLPNHWQDILEDDIIDTLSYLYPKREKEIRDILSDRNNFVWLSSANTTKISRHLVISGITFSQWRWSSIILFRELKKKHSYIDDLIARPAGSLRLPLNSKVGGEPLKFQKSIHNFEDGLILIHEENSHTVGVLLMPGDIDTRFLSMKDIVDKPSRNSVRERDDEDIDEDVCVQCFHILDKQYSTGLVLGEENNGFLSLTRERPGICPISGRIHDSLGAYIFTRDNKVFFGCHRKCTVSYAGKEYKCIDITMNTIKNKDRIAKSFKGDEEGE